MYYHVAILTKEQEKYRLKPLIKLDIIDKLKIMNEIIIPYILNKDFIFEGSCLNKENIAQLIVKSSDITASQWLNRCQSRLPPNHILLISPNKIINDRSYPIITSDLINEVKIDMNNECNSLNYLSNNKIFIVHGHEEGMKYKVARFIESLNLEAIILDEQPNMGRTIIEKIEEHSDVSYAIILYSPCDIGGIDSDHLSHRARQNVVFEHGFMVGKLGRKRVCALVKNDIEIPSDIDGIIYIPMNANWEFDLIRELKSSGFKIDTNEIFDKSI